MLALDDTPNYIATIEVNPRGQRWVSDAPGTPNGGLRFTNQIGFLGATWSSSTPGVYDDGLNEHGLRSEPSPRISSFDSLFRLSSVAQNQLDETVYPNVTEPEKCIGMRSVVAWLLGNAANVSEARVLLESGVQVWGRHGGGPGGDAGAERQHLHILDAHGGELLAEWTNGTMQLYGTQDGTCKKVLTLTSLRSDPNPDHGRGHHNKLA